MNVIHKNGRGRVFTTRDFIALGSRPAIDTALSRLVVQGQIRRLARGIYDYPKQHPLLGDLFPTLDDVAQAIAKDTNSDLQVSGARALHLLGLTTQVPAQAIYLTNGHSKDIKIGGAMLTLKHASPNVMAGHGSKAGTILQAIKYLGKHHVDAQMLRKMADQLSANDKHTLKSLLRYAPGWSRPYVENIIGAK
tara:strand:+ start:9535 stop:10113 length:579 start_codon:yes stop_codon:yes gene_type:complete